MPRHATRFAELPTSRGNANYVMNKPQRIPLAVERRRAPASSHARLPDSYLSGRAQPAQQAHVQEAPNTAPRATSSSSTRSSIVSAGSSCRTSTTTGPRACGTWREIRPPEPLSVASATCRWSTRAIRPRRATTLDYNRDADDGRHRSHRFIGAEPVSMPQTAPDLEGWEEQVQADRGVAPR